MAERRLAPSYSVKGDAAGRVSPETIWARMNCWNILGPGVCGCLFLLQTFLRGLTGQVFHLVLINLQALGLFHILAEVCYK